MAKKPKPDAKVKRDRELVRLTYFKDDGQYYCHAVEEWPVHRDEWGGVMMLELVGRVRDLIRIGGPDSLPGLLLTGERETWLGMILVELEHRDGCCGYPTLIDTAQVLQIIRERDQEPI